MMRSAAIRPKRLNSRPQKVTSARFNAKWISKSMKGRTLSLLSVQTAAQQLGLIARENNLQGQRLNEPAYRLVTSANAPTERAGFSSRQRPINLAGRARRDPILNLA